MKDAPPNVSAGFPATFQTKVAERLATCAKGKTPLRLEVSISDFHAENGAVTILAGSSNRIKGAARLIDPTTGAVVGDFDITRSVGGGGLIAALAMSEAEEQMSSAFGDEICKRAFIAR